MIEQIVINLISWINKLNRYQVREPHEVAETVDDGAGDEVTRSNEEEGRKNSEDGGVRKLKFSGNQYNLFVTLNLNLNINLKTEKKTITKQTHRK